MKVFIKGFFMTLGVIFFLILLAVGYVFATNTFGIRTLFSKESKLEQIDAKTNGIDKNPLISPSQEKALEAIGVNPANLPTKITPEMSVCFDQILGKGRTQEIKNGSTPTAVEFFKVQSCLK